MSKAILTEVSVLLPRPSWQFTTIAVFMKSVRTTNSMSSLISDRSGGRSAVIGIRAYCTSIPQPDCCDVMICLRTATSSGCTSSQIGMTDPSDVSVCSRSLRGSANITLLTSMHRNFIPSIECVQFREYISLETFFEYF